LQALDPRAKFLAAVAFILAVTLTQPRSAPVLGALAGALAVVAAVSRVPVPHLLTRALWVLPFLAVIALGHLEGVQLWILLAKGLLSALALVLLSATTPFPLLVAGLDRLGAPRFFLAVLSFAYRYIFLLVDEAEHMELGWRSRSCGWSWASCRALAGGVGVLFIRTHERAERVYLAMLSRGFGGSFPPPRPLDWRWADTTVVAGAGLLLLVSTLLASGVVG
jgi:cobalt/nickel transport system permease protein